LGWTYYKQELYEDGLDRFVALLDYNVTNGTDLFQGENELERKRIADTFRVISLSFSYLGGAEPLVDYFLAHGNRSYENHIYRNLAEYFYEKRRYADAVETYEAFIAGNPFTLDAPLFHIRVIEINSAGGFPSLVLDGKKTFAHRYGVNGEYWKHFDIKTNPQVVAYLKSDLKDLSQHYHALYQNPKFKDDQKLNLDEALNWYHQFLTAFPQDLETPAINYSLAELLLENKSYCFASDGNGELLL
jgi:tetratricopeptide (TPR) repeat protein